MGYKRSTLPLHVQRAIERDEQKTKKPMRHKSLKRQAEAAEEYAFSQVVKARNGGWCEWCNFSGGVAVHHISGRYPSIRNNPLNGIHLCFDCHRIAHDERKIFMEWLEKKRPEQYRFAMGQKKSEIDGVIIILPLPANELSPNARVHWADLAKAKKKARLHAEVKTRQVISHLFRAPYWEKATIQYTAYYNVSRTRDDDNLAASCKAYRDGIADAGIVQNDSCFTQLDPKIIVDKNTNPRLEITIIKRNGAQ